MRTTSDDALTEKEFTELLRIAREELDGELSLQAEWTLLACGRLGFRAGEVSHMKKNWINFNKEMIYVPSFEDCTCGYCKQRAESEAEHNDGLSFEQALDNRWHPKTESAERAVPYFWSEEVIDCLERFFDEYEEYPISRIGVNRRINKIEDEANLDSHLYPHALRATCATYHAFNGFQAWALQNLMGWSKLSVAQKYLRKSGAGLSRVFEGVYGDES